MRLIRYQPEYREPMLALHRSAIVGFTLGMSQQEDEADLNAIERVYLRSGGEFLLGFLENRLIAMGGFERLSQTTAELRRMRMLQANLIGPAGYVSMEDGSVGGYVQRGIAGAPEEAAAVMEMGGRDIKQSPGVRATEVALRGFWQGYRDLMGF